MRSCFAFCSLVLLTMLVTPTAQAEVYRYTDGHGKRFFVTSLEKVPPQYRYQLRSQTPLASISKVPGAPANREVPLQPSPATASYANKKVEIYVASWCNYCRQMEAFLKEKHISYQRYDIEKDTIGKKAYAKLGVTGVPVTRVGTKIIKGFDPQGVLQALAKR